MPLGVSITFHIVAYSNDTYTGTNRKRERERELCNDEIGQGAIE